MYGFVLIIYLYYQNVVYTNVLFLTIFYLRKVIYIIYSVVAEILIRLALITNQSINQSNVSCLQMLLIYEIG